MCRGCRFHFMLRPELLLPPKRLLTPRCGPGPLGQKLGPATRSTNAFLDGTCTRWFDTAFTARHALIIKGTARERRGLEAQDVEADGPTCRADGAEAIREAPKRRHRRALRVRGVRRTLSLTVGAAKC